MEKKSLWEKLEPADLIAILAFVAVIIANWKGISIMIPASVNVIIGFYFGHRAYRWKE